MKNVILTMMVLAAVACDKPSSDGTKDRARQEQEAAREVENKANADKAKQMETQLAAYHQYHAAYEGQFAGTFFIGDRKYEIMFTFARNIPEADGSRVRQLSEIEADIKNLRLRVKAVQWRSGLPLSSTPCTNQEVQLTNFASGMVSIELTCREASNTYVIYFAEPGAKAPESPEDLKLAATQAIEVAGKVNSKQINRVETIVGSIAFGNNAANAYGFTANRK